MDAGAFLSLQVDAGRKSEQVLTDVRQGLEQLGAESACIEFVIRKVREELAGSRAPAPVAVQPHFQADAQRLVDDYSDRIGHLIAALVRAYVVVWAYGASKGEWLDC